MPSSSLLFPCSLMIPDDLGRKYRRFRPFNFCRKLDVTFMKRPQPSGFCVGTDASAVRGWAGDH